MRGFDAMAAAAAWKRPYTSVQWAWVRALGVYPSRSWEQPAPARRKRGGRKPSREVRECFENRRRVDLQDRS